MTVSTMFASRSFTKGTSQSFELLADFGKVARVSVDVDEKGNTDILMTTSHESLILRLSESLARTRHPRGEYFIEMSEFEEHYVTLDFRFNICEGFAKLPEMRIV